MTDTHPLHAVVIAGGSGTRFWPLSRRHHPKQLLNLSGQDTLLHATFKRVESLVPASLWWMVVGEAHAQGCREVAPEVAPDRALVEPQARNTAPAIGLAAVHLQATAPGSMMVVLPADHHVQHPDAFCEALSKAAELAAVGPIITLGIRPTHPETGYGYIQQGDKDGRVKGAYRVERFCEKPDLARAKSFLAEGNFLWNAGIFVMRPEVYLAEMQRQLPDLHGALMDVQGAIGTPKYPQVLSAVYAKIKGISIDYGVMEHASEVAVVPADCGWSDVGSWSALGSVVPPDALGNVIRGKAVVLDSKNCVVYASDGHLVGVVGVDGLVVVHTPDATLVVPADRAQEVRDVLEKIGAQNWREWM